MIAAFPGAQVTKTRPAVVLSTAAYHEHGADVIVGLITTKSADPLRPTDCDIKNWRAAGLHAPSRFRLYLATLLQRDVRVVGRLAALTGRKFSGVSKMESAEPDHQSLSLLPDTFNTAKNASCGISTRPTRFILRFPSFCFSSNFRFREMSPP